MFWVFVKCMRQTIKVFTNQRVRAGIKSFEIKILEMFTARQQDSS